MGRPKLNQHSSTAYKLEGVCGGEGGVLFKKFSGECIHIQVSVFTRALISDKGRVSRDRGIA